MFSLMWVAGVFRRILILPGHFTRPVAFLLCGEMAVIYCFVFLYLVYAGAGPLSLDREVRKKS